MMEDLHALMASIARTLRQTLQSDGVSVANIISSTCWGVWPGELQPPLSEEAWQCRAGGTTETTE